jgi:hypothetical protein
VFLIGSEALMIGRARQVFLLALLIALPRIAAAQATWQPTPPPLVTADNETWFRAAEPIEWSGELYYPAGTPQYFNPYQMVRSGSYKGIPLYTDTTREPYSIALVPIANGRMQPYERRRSGALAGTIGSTAPSFPIDMAAEGVGVDPAVMPQAAAPPTYARAYDVGPDVAIAPTPVVAPREVVGTTGRTAALPASHRIESVVPPSGVNGIWVDYDGHRWYEAGRAVDYSAADFRQVGSYYGWTVYERPNDPKTIYIATTPGHLAPYRVR